MLTHFFVIFLPIVQSLSFVEKQMLDRLLTYYDWKIRPSDKRNYYFNKLDSSPISVNLTITFLYLQIIEEALQVQVEFVESWYDSRLTSNDKVRETFKLPDDVKVWMPRIQMTNRKESHRCKQETNYWSEGAKLSSVCRSTSAVSCSHDPSKFPFNAYRCPILLSSETDSAAVVYLCNNCVKTEDVGLPLNYKLRWYIRRNQSDINSEVWKLFWKALEKDSTSTNLELKNKITEIAEIHHYSEQTFQTLELELLLYHSPTLLYICLIFIPSALFVVLSWITVFTHRKSTKSAVQSAGLFGICILWSKVKTSSVLAVVDIWMLSCLLFIAVCIIESVLVVLMPLKPLDIHRNENSVHRSLNDLRGVLYIEQRKKQTFRDCCARCKFRLRKLFNKTVVHKIFSVTFPIVFIVYCIIYWKFIVQM